MSIMVIGGNGFLGAHVVRALIAKDQKVISFDISPVGGYNAEIKDSFIHVAGDVTDPCSIMSAIKDHGVKKVVHLASLVTLASQNNPVLAYRLNVGGLLNTLEAARIMDMERAVYASSLAVYGKTSPGQLIPETHALNPVSLYAATKVFGEELCAAYHKNYDLDFAAIRFPAMWGPGQGQLGGKTSTTGSGKFADIIEMPASGKTPLIKGASQSYDLLYAKDAAEQVALALLVPELKHHYFNAGTGTFVAIKEIGAAVQKAVPGSSIDYEEGYDYFSVPCQGPMDIGLAKSDLGYAPKYLLDEAIQDYLSYLKKIGVHK